jgi:ketosteroid isomerase-like protein
MAREPLPAIAVVVSFIDCINRTDLAGIGALMTDDHALVVLDEAPLVGRAANIEAWKGYFTAFPDYVIYPRHIAATGDEVAVFGNTTGSHLGLPDDAELKLDVAWVAKVVDGKLVRWQVAADTPDLRQRFGR